MSERTKELEQRIVGLTPAEKVELVDSVLSSLDRPDDKLDKLWLQEAEDRLAAYRGGKIRALSVDEVLEKYRSP
jgi:putative addiction module component (TIGR02574 family)